MPTYDEVSRRIVLRIVYDGPGFAGKTTNLRALEGFFTTRRRGELVTPEDIEGRTQYFDWMDLDGGLVQGHALRCRLLTVPGQRRLAGRREALLRQADALVFVSESTRNGLLEALRMMDVLNVRMGRIRADAPPLIVQANKQDLAGALSPEEVRDGLGLDGAVPVIGARASAGAGVRETLVLAIRAAADRAQLRLLEGGLDVFEREHDTPERLHARLRDLAPTGPTMELRVELAAEEPASSPLGDVIDHAALACAPPPAPTVEEPPPWPDPEAPTGSIWPAANGRELIRRVRASGAAERRDDLRGRTGTADGSGKEDLLLYRIGDFCLKTSSRRCFADLDSARAALLALARKKSSLGALLPTQTVLCIACGDDGRAWVWTVSPWVKTLGTRMDEAIAAGDATALGGALADFAEAAVASLLLTSQRSLVIDVHPSNFARTGDGLVYLDDDIGEGRQVPAIGYALLRRVEEYGAFGGAIDRYVTTLERGMIERVGVARVTALQLQHALSSVPGSTARMRDVAARINRALDRAAAPGAASECASE